MYKQQPANVCDAGESWQDRVGFGSQHLHSVQKNLWTKRNIWHRCEKRTCCTELLSRVARLARPWSSSEGTWSTRLVSRIRRPTQHWSIQLHLLHQRQNQSVWYQSIKVIQLWNILEHHCKYSQHHHWAPLAQGEISLCVCFTKHVWKKPNTCLCGFSHTCLVISTLMCNKTHLCGESHTDGPYVVCGF